MKHPMQKIKVDAEGKPRFVANKIVLFLTKIAEKHGTDLNDLADMSFSDADFAQFMQLRGYLVSGFLELSYVSEEEAARVEQRVKRLR